MSESYQKKVSKELRKTEPDKFGDASLTGSESGALRKLHKQNNKSREATIEYIIKNGYPLPENITVEDLAKAGARHACGVTEWLTETRGELAKESTYESYTIKSRFDRFVWKNLPENLKDEWRSPIGREGGYKNKAVNYPDNVDKTKIYGGALPHRFLSAQTMKNLELARLGKLDDRTLKEWNVPDNFDLSVFAIEWKQLIPAIQRARTLVELTKNIKDKIIDILQQNNVAQNIIDSIIETGFRTKGLKWEHGNFEGSEKYDFLLVKPGHIYIHDDGLSYRIDSIDINTSDSYNEEIHDVTSYEDGIEPKEFNIQKHTQDELAQYVLYTQLEAGKYPAGKKWVRDKKDFLKHFVKQ